MILTGERQKRVLENVVKIYGPSAISSNLFKRYRQPPKKVYGGASSRRKLYLIFECSMQHDDKGIGREI